MNASDSPEIPPADSPESPPEESPAPVAPPPAELAVEAAPPPAPRGPLAWYRGLSVEAKWVFWATVIGGIGRLCFIAFVHKPWKLVYSDMQNYVGAAEHYADLGRATDSGDWYYPSGTAANIGIWLLVFGKHYGLILAGLWQALLATAVIPLTFLAGRRFFGARVGMWTALIYSVHYLPIGFAGLFMSENYLTIGLALAMAAYVPDSPKRSFWAGMALGFGAWAKSQAFLLAPLWGLLLLWRGRRWKSAAAVMVGVLIWVIPISIVASKKSGVPSFISANGGQTFALGQCPIRSMIYEHPTQHWRISWSAPDLNQRAPRGEPEGAWGDALFHVPFNNSRYYMRVGWDCIRRWPANAVRTEFLHFMDTFSGPPWSNIVPWPESHDGYWVPAMLSNWFVAYLMAPLAFFAWWKKRREDNVWITFGLPFVSVIFTAVMFHGDPRFREPYDFLFIMAGVEGFFLVWPGLRDRCKKIQLALGLTGA